MEGEGNDNPSQQRRVRWEYTIPHPKNLSAEEQAESETKGLPISVKVWAQDFAAYHQAIGQGGVDEQVKACIERQLGSFKRDLKRSLRASPHQRNHLSVKQVAQSLHVTEPTVREWIKSGELTASRIGPEGKARIYCVRGEDLDEFLHRRRVDPVTRDVDDQAADILATLKKGA